MHIDTTYSGVRAIGVPLKKKKYCDGLDKSQIAKVRAHPGF
jgi:hypothetical protein